MSWGFVTMTLDVFTPGGIAGRKTCISPAPLELAEDVYRALNVLAARKYMDPKHVFVIGFGRSTSLAFAAIELMALSAPPSGDFAAQWRSIHRVAAPSKGP